jgi:Flp pilus assembly protein TadD
MSHPSERTAGGTPLDRAYALLRAGHVSEAEALCRDFLDGRPHDASATHLLGLIRKDAGDTAGGERLLVQSIELEPSSAAFRANLGHLLRRLGRAHEAERHYRDALAIDPRHRPARFGLARTLGDLGRFAAAEAECRTLIGANAADAQAWTGLAMVLRDQNRLAEAVSLKPTDTEAQLNLARLRHMRQDPEFARDIVAAAAASGDNAELQLLHATVLWRAGALAAAESICRDLLARRGPDPDVRVTLARVLQEGGRLQEAELEAVEAVASKPDDATIVETLVAILLSRSRPEDALPFIAAQRARDADDQGWIAYEATATRLLDPPRYRELCDYRRLVRTFDLEPPAGWSSMAELNAAVLDALNARHRFTTHPLDQSVRNGSQTARSLLTDPDPAIRALMQAFAAPLRSYQQLIGASSAHPLSARNRGSARFSGAWSVQLRREGYHVNHFHPQGWISSAYYVSVPDEVNNLDLMSGWIKFGEPRFAVPTAVPEVFVKPHPGRLVLFPSYLWHGTNPIHGSEPRTAIAFDAVPGSGNASR